MASFRRDGQEDGWLARQGVHNYISDNVSRANRIIRCGQEECRHGEFNEQSRGGGLGIVFIRGRCPHHWRDGGVVEFTHRFGGRRSTQVHRAMPPQHRLVLDPDSLHRPVASEECGGVRAERVHVVDTQPSPLAHTHLALFVHRRTQGTKAVAQ